MGCVPSKKASLESNNTNKNSRVSQAPTPILNNKSQQNINTSQASNFLSASRIAGDLEQQTKQNTYKNSLPKGQNTLRNSIVMSPVSHPPVPPVMSGNFKSALSNNGSQRGNNNNNTRGDERQQQMQYSQRSQSPNNYNTHQIPSNNMQGSYQENQRLPSPRMAQHQQNPQFNQVMNQNPQQQYSNQMSNRPQNIPIPQPPRQNQYNQSSGNSPRQQMTNQNRSMQMQQQQQQQKMQQMQHNQHNQHNQQQQKQNPQSQQMQQQQIQQQQMQQYQLQQQMQQQIHQQMLQIQQQQMLQQQQMQKMQQMMSQPPQPQPLLQHPSQQKPFFKQINKQTLQQIMRQTDINDQGFGSVYVQRMDFGARAR